MATQEDTATVPGIAVSAVGAALHSWRPSDPRLFSRSEVRRQTGTYSSAIPAQLAAWSPTLTSELGADLEDATRALSDFDRHASLALGMENATLGPMSAILLRTESASSSQIENLTVSAKQLALAEIGAGASPNSQTVLGNVRAMEAAVALTERLSVDAILTMHRELLTHQRGMEEHAGGLRRELVWIGKGNAGPREADFVAPQSELVPSALDDLLTFANRVDLPALLQIAVAHAQFETIHPFVDGNGRTGRALVQVMLRASGFASQTTVPLSAGLLTDLDRYFDALGAFRAGDAEPIVRTFAGAARFAAAAGGDLVDALRSAFDESRELLAGVRRQATGLRLLPLLIGQPIVDSAFVQRALAVDAVTANRALSLLTERGVLTEQTGRRRGKVWQHSAILDALEDFAAGTRRARR
ncbi:cell filamentation protein Fic [Pseudoclavibacter sp. AY1F1]|uniref:Fic family protein n=1 Tax=Pseudoclavibacter sp. AY1F1 TaxID=2080583 RepID=UPI000CE72D98|nr:Fic family protein [Pseudoclavibacter sp. AY1F1]PPF46007.1 cell filamentation protein Fic [Pseudoclavibacter sp. AY1F1]